MNIVLQSNESEYKKLDKKLTDVKSVDGVLREETSVTDPVFMIAADGVTVTDADITSANYLTCAAFSRSYFITDIRSVRNGFWAVTCHVDVLSSYAAQIRANSGIISKQEKKWNLYIDDGTFKTYQDPHIYTKTFPSGFDTFSFVMCVAGSPGNI